jgi:signal transduction histidine kinase
MRFIESFGLKPQTFGATYEAFPNAVHPDDRKAVDEAYSGSFREGRDFSMLKRVFINLIQNAVQAMPNSGALKITAQRQGNEAEFSVEDTGEGIPEEVKGKLFTPLFTTKSKGQGFGLAVVKRLIEVQHGKNHI